MEWKKYAADALFHFPLINAGAIDFEAGVTIAAGDAKVFTNSLILTNVSCEAVAFTSLSELPTNGDQLDGATSGETCIFMFAVITSGTVGGGDAAGVLFVKTVSGAFQSENLNINGGTANVMTIPADFTAGLFGAVGSGYYCVALTAAEMTCARGFVSIIDSATKEWEDQAIRFETYGNAAAAHAIDLDATIASQAHDAALSAHVSQGTTGWSLLVGAYNGPEGPGIYLDSGSGNTNTVLGTDGTFANPVSTFAAARTLADALVIDRYYLEGNSDLTLAATHVDWEFVGVGAVGDNTINLGSQDVGRSRFHNLTLEGVQGGSDRMEAVECALQDPGGGVSTFHIFALRCGLVDDIEVDTSNNNVFEDCYSLVAGSGTPSIIATGAAGTIEVRHYSGGIEFKALSASHNLSVEGMGQVVFNANCNVNANVSVRGLFTITDNTAGMASLTQEAVFNRAAVNAEVDTALNDAVADSIPADGTAPSVRQGIYMLTQFLLERAVSGTTVTVKKPDGSTTLFTLTINDATTPTDITRAT